MKAALVIAVLVLLKGGMPSYNPYPYMEKNNITAYNDSVHNHIPLEEFDTASIPEGKGKRNIGPVLMLRKNTTYNPKPCMKNRNNNAYNKFASKHVLKTVFNTSSRPAWKKYLEKNKLCDRPRQSFVDKGAQNLYVKICNGFGKRQDMNLCTSTSPVRLHDLNVSTSDCSITYLYSGDKYVTVACDKVNNRCLPVHFQSIQYSGPNSTAQTCKP